MFSPLHYILRPTVKLNVGTLWLPVTAAEIDGMTVHSFLGQERNKKKSKRTSRAGQTKLENEWRFMEYVILDEMFMVGLRLLAWLSNIITTAKHADPIVPVGAVILEQQMRTIDTAYQDLLCRLRKGAGTYEDWLLLQTRVIGKGRQSSLNDASWNEVRDWWISRFDKTGKVSWADFIKGNWYRRHILISSKLPVVFKITGTLTEISSR